MASREKQTGAGSLALLVDDDVELGELLQDALDEHDVRVELAHDGRRGLARALSGEHDLLLLDVMLPGLDGFELLRLVRRQSRVPVIMLTARSAAADQVAGLDAGADDYLPKPFGTELLMARIRAVLRRSGRGFEEASVLEAGGLRLQLRAREASVDGCAGRPDDRRIRHPRVSRPRRRPDRAAERADDRTLPTTGHAVRPGTGHAHLQPEKKARRARRDDRHGPRRRLPAPRLRRAGRGRFAMRSILATILLWAFATIAFCVAGIWVIARAREKSPPSGKDPVLSIVAMLGDDARQAFDRGGPAGLSDHLREVAGKLPGERFLTDSNGKDLVDGSDRTTILREIGPGPARLGDGRFAVVSNLQDGRYRFVWIVEPWFDLPSPTPFIAVIVAIIALMGTALAFYLSRPLRRLRQAMDRFGRGDLQRAPAHDAATRSARSPVNSTSWPSGSRPS